MLNSIVTAGSFADKLAERPVVTIDFEASCLPAWGSYPIEVAASSVANGAVKSWLIKPPAEWRRNGRWETAAECLHGISQEMLETEGLPVDTVRDELASFVGCHAVSDAALSDGFWLDILYDGKPGFLIENVSDALRRMGLCPPAVDIAEIEAARQTALIRFPRLHTARSDCQRVAEAFRILINKSDDGPTQLEDGTHRKVA